MWLVKIAAGQGASDQKLCKVNEELVWDHPVNECMRQAIRDTGRDG